MNWMNEETEKELTDGRGEDDEQFATCDDSNLES